MKPFSTDGKHTVFIFSIIELAIHLHMNISGNINVFNSDSYGQNAQQLL